MNRNARRAFSSALAMALVAVSGCLPIPHRHTRQAGARFRVTDQAGRAIAGAFVSTYTGSVIGGELQRQATAQSDAAGEVTISRRRTWHYIVLLIPDAEAGAVYGWCVSAPHHAALGRIVEDEDDQSISAPLMPGGAATGCPERLDRYMLEEGKIQAPAV
jgi:hypothetical protein